MVIKKGIGTKHNVTIIPEDRLDVSSVKNHVNALDGLYSENSSNVASASDTTSLNDEPLDFGAEEEEKFSCRKCCKRKRSRFHSSRQFSVRSLFFNMGRKTVMMVDRMSGWGTMLTKTEELFSYSSTEHYRGPTNLDKLREGFGRLDDLLCFHQISKRSFEMEQLEFLRRSSLEDDDSELMLNVRRYLIDVTNLENENLMGVVKARKSGWFGRIFGDHEKSKSPEDRKQSFFIRRKLDKMFASDKILKQIRTMLVGSVDHSTFKVCINTVWLIFYREKSTACVCSKQSICEKCLGVTSRKFCKVVRQALAFQDSQNGC